MRLILLLALVLTTNLLSAQKDPMKFGKLPPEDLAMKIYEPDTSASAVVLGDYGHVWFDFPVYQVVRHKRIKIMKRSGFDEADIKIGYFGKPKDKVIGNLKAKIYLPSGKEIEVAKEAFFIERVDDFRSSINFSFPQLEEGAVIEYRYEYVTSYRSLPDWYFQSNLPHRWSELLMEVPEWFEYVPFMQGRPTDKTETEQKTGTIVLTSEGQTASRGLRINVSRMVMNNVPALKQEPFITTMSDYYARIRFQLKSIAVPGNVIEDEIPSWRSLSKLLVEDESFGGQYLKKRNYSKAWEAVQPSLAGLGTPQEKANAIYDFVCKNIAISSYDGIFVQKNLNDCFEKKSAQANEANLLVVALLKEAGLEASPMLISRRSHGFPMTIYPFWEQFDYVVAVAAIDSSKILLDATNPFRPLNYLHEDALNGEGWIVRKDNPEWIGIAAKQTSDTYLLNCTMNENGELQGKLTISFDGYSAVKEREALKDKPAGDQLKEDLAAHYPDIKLDSLQFDNKDNLAKPLKATMKCTIPGQAQINGDFLYFTPASLSAFNESPFKLKTREYPVDMPYPFKEQIVMNLTLPAGYVVEDLPESLTMALHEDSGKFQFRVSQKGNVLQVTSTLQMNHIYFDAEAYEGIYDFFSRLEEKLGEQVVLKKG